MVLMADTFGYPLRKRYKQQDSFEKDTVTTGDYYRTNWLLAEYKLLGKYPSIHEGDDVVGKGFNCWGDDVLAIANGEVVYSRLVPNSTWGNKVIIRHTLLNGYQIYSRYAHLKKRLVEVGDEVLMGQLIGYIGGPEWGMAPHLHIAICVTDLIAPENDPLNWPSNSRNTLAQARAIINTNYIDPLFFIDQYQVGKPDPIPVPIPDEEIPPVTFREMWTNTTGVDRLMLRHDPYRPPANDNIRQKLPRGTAVMMSDYVQGTYVFVRVAGTPEVHGFVAREFLTATKPPV